MGSPTPTRWFPVVATLLVCVTIGSLVVALDRMPGRSRPPSTPDTVRASVSDHHLRGRHVFQRHCAVCHGKWGDGRGEMAVGMRPRPRDFTAGIFKFRSTPSGCMPTDGDLRRTIRQGIANSSMPTFGSLAENEVAAVVDYLKTLSPRWEDKTASAAVQHLGHVPSWLADPALDAEHRAAGEVTFVTHCAPCHGDAADGVSALANSLEDIWGQPCPPADLRYASLKSGPEPIDIFRTISTGLDGSPMPSFAESLSAEQRWDLVAYLIGLRHPNELPGAPETR